jgi:hypothetical protein
MLGTSFLSFSTSLTNDDDKKLAKAY